MFVICANPHSFVVVCDSHHLCVLHLLLLLVANHTCRQMSIPSLPVRPGFLSSPSVHSYGYGSTSRANCSAPSKYSINSTPHSTYIQPGTTPPRLFTQSPTFR